jgi:GntR family transcriptional regulator
LADSMEIQAELDRLLVDLHPGQKIPSERVLAQQFGIARMTLRSVVETFILEGKLERRPGSGTYISNQCYSLSARCKSFSSEMKSRGLDPENELLNSKIISADKVSSKKLRIPLNSKILKFSRLRLGSQIPMAYQTTALPLAYIDEFEPDELEGSLEDLLLNRFGIHISNSQTEISGGFVNQKVSKLLGITTATPCLMKETLDVDTRSRIIMWNKTWYNAEQFKIRFDATCNIYESRTSTAS